MSAERPIVLFRQVGNNLRLGNTMVWIASAYAWCSRHGFEFFFPTGRRVLGALLDNDSPLFAVPETMRRVDGIEVALAIGLPAGSRSANAAPKPDQDSIPSTTDGALSAMDVLLARQVARARESATAKRADPRLVSLAPGQLGCIVETREIIWDDQPVIDFVRAHRLCVVNEPHPFTVSEPIPAALLARLLPPSGASMALLQAATMFRSATGGLRVGLHVRQTDYRRWQGGRFYRDNVFYAELARGALQLLPVGSTLMIAHDGEFDPSPDLAADPRIEFSGGTLVEVPSDFVRFATCDILIGPWSTFTIQAAKLGELWTPARRERIDIMPESTVESLLVALSQRVSTYPHQSTPKLSH